MEIEKEASQVITFFSYKGGTGRTMCLANTAFLLSKRSSIKKGILLIDWDLESPGLHHFLRDSLEIDRVKPSFSDQPGLIDLFISIDSTLSNSEYQKPNNLDSFFNDVNVADYIVQTKTENIKFMKAGNFDDKYSSKINSFKWDELFNRAPWLFTSFAEYLSSLYDYVLIDSRTGITDTSGICTMLMPEKLVLVFTPTQQSLKGLLDLIPKAVHYRKQSDDLRPLVIFPLPSRIETTESELRESWRHGNPEKSIEGYQPLFEKILKEVYELLECNLQKYFDNVQIQHVPSYSYGEVIAVNIERNVNDRLSLSSSYDRFTNRLVNRISPWTESASDYEAKETPDSETAFEILVDFKKSIRASSKNAKDLATQYLDSFISVLDIHRLDPKENSEVFWDEQVFDNISSFISRRDEFVDFVKHICQYEEDSSYFDLLFEFFEKSISFIHPPKGVTSWNDIWYDNFRFILRELYIYSIALFIKYKKYDAIDMFLEEDYYYSTNIENKYSSYTVFDGYISTFDNERNARLKLNKISLSAEILKDRATLQIVPFDDIMQTDFILCLRKALHTENDSDYWFPHTIFYAKEHTSHGFELFFKARSKRHFDSLKRILKVESKDDLVTKYQNSQVIKMLSRPSPRYLNVSYNALLNLDNLDSA